MTIHQDQAYILHSRPYRESSQLTDLFSREQGRVRVVHRGGRNKRLLPFTPLQVAWSGKSELHTLRSAEAIGVSIALNGPNLYAGIYLNELLERLLHYQEPHQYLYECYEVALQQLSTPAEPVDVTLRRYEYALLGELGYGYDFQADSETGDAVEADQWYWFDPDAGCRRGLRSAADTQMPNWVLGQHLLEIADNNLDSDAVRKAAKRINRIALGRLLGDRPLKSRELFRQLQSPAKEAVAR
ncbi:MAG: DNA repair protein RecO [bacterium]